MKAFKKAKSVKLDIEIKLYFFTFKFHIECKLIEPSKPLTGGLALVHLHFNKRYYEKANGKRKRIQSW